MVLVLIIIYHLKLFWKKNLKFHPKLIYGQLELFFLSYFMERNLLVMELLKLKFIIVELSWMPKKFSFQLRLLWNIKFQMQLKILLKIVLDTNNNKDSHQLKHISINISNEKIYWFLWIFTYYLLSYQLYH
jgi:hypothetical protein